MITYRLIFEEITEYGNSRRSFGIAVDKSSSRIRVIRDITDDGERLSRFVEDMNKYSLDPIHLDEVIEDFLCNK